jgi:hypothetical protein
MPPPKFARDKSHFAVTAGGGQAGTR